MAEVLLRALIPAEVEVASAGTHALVGHPADEQARRLMTERGLDLSAHRAQQASPELLRWADLVLVMEARHLHELHALAPAARGKLFLAGHWLGDREITDPYKEDRSVFERTLGELDETLASWLPKLSPATPG